MNPDDMKRVYDVNPENRQPDSQQNASKAENGANAQAPSKALVIIESKEQSKALVLAEPQEEPQKPKEPQKPRQRPEYGERIGKEIFKRVRGKLARRFAAVALLGAGAAYLLYEKPPEPLAPYAAITTDDLDFNGQMGNKSAYRYKIGDIEKGSCVIASPERSDGYTVLVEAGKTDDKFVGRVDSKGLKRLDSIPAKCEAKVRVAPRPGLGM